MSNPYFLHRVRLPGIPAADPAGHPPGQGPQGICLRGAVYTGKALPVGRAAAAGLTTDR